MMALIRPVCGRGRSTIQLGYVTVAAPRDHMSATGRGHQKGSDGTLTKKVLNIKGQDWDVYAVGGSPSQSVTHALSNWFLKSPTWSCQALTRRELRHGCDYSGTVGAALEALRSVSRPWLYPSNYPTRIGWLLTGSRFYDVGIFHPFFARICWKASCRDVDVLNIVVPEEAPGYPLAGHQIGKDPLLQAFVCAKAS